MPINSTNPQYDANIEKWQRCRDAYNGSDAIKAGGEKYLPRICGQSDDEYNAYQMRPCFYEVVARTIDGLIGAFTRLPNFYDLPTEIVPMLTEASKDGLTLDEVVKGLLAETILQGRAGILTDIDAATQMPYFTTYSAEAITNWSDNQVILHESVLEPDPLDEFKLVETEQYRQLHLVDGEYTVTVWRKMTDAITATWYVYSRLIPTRRGKPMTEIPFAWVTPLGSTPRMSRPPLLGVVDLALQHYRVSADLFHGLFYTACPTLYITGISEDKSIQVGGAAAILLPSENAKVGYLEYAGTGLGSIRQALDDIERRAGSLGGSILLAERERATATATEALIRNGHQTAVLSATVAGVEDALKRALSIAAWWVGGHGPIEVKLNAEFIPATLNAQMVSALVQGLQAGAISVAQLQAALIDGGAIEAPSA